MLEFNIVIRQALIILLVSVLAGCTKLGALNTVLPKDDHTSEIIRDIAYGSHERQKLDIYIPRTESKSLPVVVFVYGGSWNSGRKQDYSFAGHALNSDEFIAVIPDYRLVPEVVYPDFLHDIADALNWTHSNIEKYGGQPNNLFLLGHSAGAYNAMMVGLASNEFTSSRNRIPVQGVVGMAGPYNFIPLATRVTKAAFGHLSDLTETQPAEYLNADSPALLLITGGSDQFVLPKHSQYLHQYAQNKGVDSQLVNYPEVGHIKLLLSLSKPFRGQTPALKDSVDFFRQNLSE